MNTPPKDKPVRKDENLSAETDEFKTDEAVAAQDTEISAQQTDPTDQEVDNHNGDDLNADRSQIGLNTDDQDEIL